MYSICMYAYNFRFVTRLSKCIYLFICLFCRRSHLSFSSVDPPSSAKNSLFYSGFTVELNYTRSAPHMILELLISH